MGLLGDFLFVDVNRFGHLLGQQPMGPTASMVGDVWIARSSSSRRPNGTDERPPGRVAYPQPQAVPVGVEFKSNSSR